MDKQFTSKNKDERKRLQTEARNNFYLSFFDASSKEYCEKNINGFWLVKSWNPERQQNQCALYTEGSFKRDKQLS